MNSSHKIISLLITANLSACATNPKKIEASYVSHVPYLQFTCEQLLQESAALSVRYADLSQHLLRRHDIDSSAIGVGLGVAWPALLLMRGNSPSKEIEYANVQGAINAVGKAMSEKKCGQIDISFPEDLRDQVGLLPSEKDRQIPQQ